MKNETILALSSRNGWQPAILLNTAGEQEELGCFERDDTTQAEFSCAVNWNNQMFIFGGWSRSRQISKLTGHKLEHIGDLSFDHRAGACSVMANRFIFLCFNRADSNDWKRCRQSSGPLEQFSEVALASHRHLYGLTSSSESKFSIYYQK